MFEYLEQRIASKCVQYDILHLYLISRQKVTFIPELHQSHWDPRSAHTQQRCLPSATQTGGQWRWGLCWAKPSPNKATRMSNFMLRVEKSPWMTLLLSDSCIYTYYLSWICSTNEMLANFQNT